MAETIDNVTFNVDGSNYSYIAQNVRVEREWVGKRRRMATRENIIYTEGYHLIFEVSGEEIEQVGGTTKDVHTLQTDLEDPAKTVTINVDSVDHAVISDMEGGVIFETEYGTRRNSETIRCITKELIADLTEFENE